MQYLLSAIIAAVVSIGSFFVPHQPQNQLTPQIQAAIQQYVDKSLEGPVFGSTLPIAGQTYNLSGAGVSQTATSITLASLTVTQTGQKILDSDLSDTFFITLEPGNSTRQEIVSCTTVVQNANGSATLSGCSRGLSPITPYTASTTLRFSHGGGTQVIFSNPPQFYNQFAILANTSYITGAWGFQTTAPTSTICTTGNALCNKDYVDNVARSGVATSTETNGGQSELGTLAEQATSFDGGASKPTVLQTKNSTSTCQVVGPYNIVASSTTGKLDRNCFDQTSSYALTGSSFGATGTSTLATTTMASSTVTNGLNVGANATTTFNGGGLNGIYDYQVFTSSGTWTKPTNILGTEVVMVEAWGAGGGGGTSGAAAGTSGGGGGGGGACVIAYFRASDLTSTVTVTIGTGAAATVGGNTTFGAFLTAYGGGAGQNESGNTNASPGGGGGGLFSVGTVGNSDTTGGTGGSPLGGASTAANSGFGGGGGGAAGVGGVAVYGGGGGGGFSGSANAGAASYCGGGGGASGGGAASGGTSVLGGAGGAAVANTVGGTGSAPGGGGAGGSWSSGAAKAGGPGGRGEIRVWTYR